MKNSILKLFTAFFCFIAFFSTASEKSSLSAQLSKCGQISSANDRLACFDDLAKSVSSNLNEASKSVSIPVVKSSSVAASTPASSAAPVVASTPVVTVPKEPSATKQVDEFAKEHLKKSEEEQGLDSISSKVTKVKKLMHGHLQVTLENGQQWQQKDTTKLKLKVGDIVRLKKSPLGAVYLNKEGNRRNIRVKRLK